MDTETSTKKKQKTFEDIALCLSGGGYRAAAFHFGSMDMLDELGLLDNVKMLSTASGGTITAVAYALAKVEEKPFDQFFKSFIAFLKDVNVIEEALEKALEALDKNPDLDIRLIEFAAEVYQEHLFGKKTKNAVGEITAEEKTGKKFDVFLDAVDKPFQDLVFNATELRLGNSFRFRASRKNALIGSQNFNIGKEAAREIWLGDIVASSSCFPGGFDPFIFPTDFHFDVKDRPRIEGLLGRGFSNKGEVVPLPLMDGGIFDNQGVYGIQLANAKKKANVDGDADDDLDGDDPDDNSDDKPDLVIAVEDDRIDLIIIADSNPLKKDLFPLPVAKRDIYPKHPIPLIPKSYTEISLLDASADLIGKGRKWAKWSIWGAYGLLAVAVVALAYLIIFIVQNQETLFTSALNVIFALAIPAVFVLALFALPIIALRKLSQAKSLLYQAEAFIDDHDELILKDWPRFKVWSLIKKANLPAVIKVVETRITSTLALTTDLFLKRIRDLGVKGIKADTDTGPRVAFNYITDINHFTNIKKRKEIDKAVEPTADMITIMNEAGKYPTNLWCTKPEDIERVILAGQMSICYTLLGHLWTIWKAEKKAIEKENAERAAGQQLLPLPEPPNSPDSEYNELYKKVMRKWKQFKNKERVSYLRSED